LGEKGNIDKVAKCWQGKYTLLNQGALSFLTPGAECSSELVFLNVPSSTEHFNY
jgi:hypothetical protein